MTLQEAKDNLLKKVNTPFGEKILYGINCLPNDNNTIGLIFYFGIKQKILFSIDCSVIKTEQ